MNEPRIEEVRGGYAALGDGWAVVAASPDEARKRFRDAERVHQEIAARPDPVTTRPDLSIGQQQHA